MKTVSFTFQFLHALIHRCCDVVHGLMGRNVSIYSGNNILPPLFVEEDEPGFIDQRSGDGAALTLPATYRLIAMGLADLVGADSCVTRIANGIGEGEFRLGLVELQRIRWSIGEMNDGGADRHQCFRNKYL